MRNELRKGAASGRLNLPDFVARAALAILVAGTGKRAAARGAGGSVALLVYGTLIFLWQRGRKRNSTSSRGSSRVRAMIYGSTWSPRVSSRLKSHGSREKWTKGLPLSFGVSMRSYKCSSMSTRVGSGNWRPQSSRFENRIFANDTAARLLARGCVVFHIV